MDAATATFALKFLERVELRGPEAVAFVTVVRALEALVQEQNLSLVESPESVDSGGET